jgi:hypothetical protein
MYLNLKNKMSHIVLKNETPVEKEHGSVEHIIDIKKVVLFVEN